MTWKLLPHCTAKGGLDLGLRPWEIYSIGPGVEGVESRSSIQNLPNIDESIQLVTNWKFWKIKA